MPVDPSDHPGGASSAAQTPSKRVSAGQSAVPEPLERLAELIAGSPHNLVSAREREHVLERHIVESLAVAERLAPRGRWMDLGTGGGLPGLVLAWRHRDVAWTLLDATAKKVEAVRTFAAALQLDNVSVVQGRAEALAWDRDHRGRYAGVVARAVAPLPTLLELARGFLAPKGTLAAVKGPTWGDEAKAAHAAMRTLRYGSPSPERLPTADRESWLVTMQAQGSPPSGYPRRDGVPKSDPLR